LSLSAVVTDEITGHPTPGTYTCVGIWNDFYNQSECINLVQRPDVILSEMKSPLLRSCPTLIVT